MFEPQFLKDVKVSRAEILYNYTTENSKPENIWQNPSGCSLKKLFGKTFSNIAQATPRTQQNYFSVSQLFLVDFDGTP